MFTRVAISDFSPLRVKIKANSVLLVGHVYRGGVVGRYRDTCGSIFRGRTHNRLVLAHDEKRYTTRRAASKSGTTTFANFGAAFNHDKMKLFHEFCSITSLFLDCSTNYVPRTTLSSR